MTTYPNARRGDIWYVSDDALGGKNEDDRIIRGSRPVLIVSVDDHNFTSSCLTVVPISSGDRRIDGSGPSNVILHSKCLERKSAAVVSQITTIDRDGLQRFLGTASFDDRNKVVIAICQYLNV